MIYKTNNEYYANEVFVESGIFDELDRWKTHNQNHNIQVYKSSTISDSDYEKLHELVREMREDEKYEDYKKAFDKFCYFCHIVSRGVIIKKLELKKNTTIPDHNFIKVEYSYNTKKIDIPEGTMLYHMSKVGGIKELIPCFRGKSVKGYLYDKSRVYFTIRKNMPKFLADYKFNEKLHLYVCKQDIKQAYVDPLVWANIQGAVYVETTKPIPVEEITNQNILNNIIKKITPNKYVTESEFDANEFFSFIDENGLIIEEIY